MYSDDVKPLVKHVSFRKCLFFVILTNFILNSTQKILNKEFWNRLLLLKSAGFEFELIKIQIEIGISENWKIVTAEGLKCYRSFSVYACVYEYVFPCACGLCVCVSNCLSCLLLSPPSPLLNNRIKEPIKVKVSLMSVWRVSFTFVRRWLTTLKRKYTVPGHAHCASVTHRRSENCNRFKQFFWWAGSVGGGRRSQSCRLRPTADIWYDIGRSTDLARQIHWIMGPKINAQFHHNASPL